MDMVCEKDADCLIDMAAEGLDLTHNDSFVYARGTTLGGDDGIAVAMAMALLADKTIPHPPIEAIITVDEEIGLLGAASIDLSQLKGRTLINIDSEEEGIFTVSCAGGATAKIALLAPLDADKSNLGIGLILTNGISNGDGGIDVSARSSAC